LTTARLHWSLDPSELIALAVYAGVYIWRFKRVRADTGSRGAGLGQAASFAGAFLALFIALISPLDGLGEDYLFSAHMAQHLLIADIAPALTLLALSRVIVRPATRRLHTLERRLGPMSHPAAVLCFGLALILVWHVPVAYDLALNRPLVHSVEHMCFFAAGTAIWWPLIQPVPLRRRLTGLQTLAYLASAKLCLGLLAVYLAWSKTPIYSHYQATAHIFGLDPLSDQNVGGAIMMVEQSIVFCIAVSVVFMRMLSQSEQQERRRERLEREPSL
jgi:putative membrane protein